ncbi:GHKL domain-containing protein [[Clostridium] innocuum]|uniref:GHKL domain-containing protein n=1 Tax=Clostridium TaxID=1485 RepID=UPI001CD153F5|nr:GHKL domain-containing protein [[Clostridium] innocuum]MCQ4710623.1 ATP-binding protein [[Clostridium] innocuum]
MKWNDDVLSTSKKDKDKHGYGLKNIKELCEKYQGSMEINIENAIFQLILSFLKI